MQIQVFEGCKPLYTPSGAMPTNGSITSPSSSTCQGCDFVCVDPSRIVPDIHLNLRNFMKSTPIEPRETISVGSSRRMTIGGDTGIDYFFNTMIYVIEKEEFDHFNPFFFFSLFHGKETSFKRYMINPSDNTSGMEIIFRFYEYCPYFIHQLRDYMIEDSIFYPAVNRFLEHVHKPAEVLQLPELRPVETKAEMLHTMRDLACKYAQQMQQAAYQREMQERREIEEKVRIGRENARIKAVEQRRAMEQDARERHIVYSQIETREQYLRFNEGVDIILKAEKTLR
jgi:hypothetical protein